MRRRTFLFSAAALAVSGAATSLYWPERWKYIVIHHSAGSFGNIEFLQRVHRERQPYDPIDAIPYHYIIGNGNGMEMGEVASDWRQHHNIWGSHVSANNKDINFRGIGICLIGNFEEHPVPEPQYQSLLQLTRQLIIRYSIELDNISGHGLTDAEHTQCPGEHFPIDRLYMDLKQGL